MSKLQLGAAPAVGFKFRPVVGFPAAAGLPAVAGSPPTPVPSTSGLSASGISDANPLRKERVRGGLNERWMMGGERMGGLVGGGRVREGRVGGKRRWVVDG